LGEVIEVDQGGEAGRGGLSECRVIVGVERREGKEGGGMGGGGKDGLWVVGGE
jgi:hypothetical protein